MAVLRIAKMGNPVLLKKAEPVADPTAPEIRRRNTNRRSGHRRDRVREPERLAFVTGFPVGDDPDDRPLIHA